MNKVAMVIVGAKTIKLIFANCEPNKSFYIYDEIEETIDVAVDLSEGGMIKNNASNETIKILKMYKKMCEKQGIENIYAYLTSFVTKAKNQISFIDEIESASGLRFKLLSLEDEMTATYMAVVNSLDVARGIIIDVRENCTNIIKYFSRNVLSQVNIPIGANSLAQLFANTDFTPQETHEQMVDFFKTQLVEYDINEEFVDGFKFVCVGKMGKTLYKMATKVQKYPLDIEHNYTINNVEYDKVYNVIKTLEVDSTKRIKGIFNDGADVFAGGMSIYKAIFDLLSEYEVTFTPFNITEGLLLNLALPVTLEKPITDIMQLSLDSLSSQYKCSKSNGAKVCELAVLIFKQLKVLHKLPRTYLKSLRIASTLYRSGEVINFSNLYKNNFNVILSSAIYGATHKEQLLAAFIAQNVDVDAFNLADWVRYKELLNEEDLDAMKKLSAILSIAIGLDITENGSITDLFCDVLGDSVIMKTTTENDVEFEIKYALHSSKNFKKAFNKYLEIL